MPSLRADPTTDHAPGRDDVPQGAVRRSSTSRRRPGDRRPRGRSSSGGDVPELRHERFQIGDKLGEGGMGVVYRARDTRDGRDVALKLMKGTLAGTARRRFEREFRSLSALHHPALPGRLRLRRARRRPVLHHGAVPGPADHQPGRSRPARGARPAAATDPGARLHPRPRHRPPRRQAVEHPGPPGDPRRRPSRTSRPG